MFRDHADADADVEQAGLVAHILEEGARGVELQRSRGVRAGNRSGAGGALLFRFQQQFLGGFEEARSRRNFSSMVPSCCRLLGDSEQSMSGYFLTFKTTLPIRHNSDDTAVWTPPRWVLPSAWARRSLMNFSIAGSRAVNRSSPTASIWALVAPLARNPCPR